MIQDIPNYKLSQNYIWYGEFDVDISEKTYHFAGNMKYAPNETFWLELLVSPDCDLTDKFMTNPFLLPRKEITIKGKILNNLNYLEKMLQKCAENINNTLLEFNKTKKLYDEARRQFVECKKKIEEENEALTPVKEKLEKELLTLEKDVDKTLMAEYKKRRNDNIFPVVVPLEGKNFCGRCRMELPMAAISKLKNTGVITCEHCKRLIYQKD